MRDGLEHISRLQAWRGRRSRDLAIADLVRAQVDQAAKSHARLGELVTLWRTHVPEPLVDRTVLTGFRHGVLQVKADSAATVFEVDRLLRSGLEGLMRSQFKGSLSKVKVRIGSLDETTAAIDAAGPRAAVGRASGSPAIARRPRRR